MSEIKLTKEQLEKAKQAKSAEELLALAKENGIELTEEKARAFYGKLSSEELADEELENAVGGMSDVTAGFDQHERYVC
ncbi:MAG: Nif11-like leader peptide family RiPP precursor [Eubacteriales bacterium]|nr:Nif11-like leader peptide family RiPP precursor [Eubacteriales bacterium]